MVPTLEDGDLIVVDTRVMGFTYDGIYVFELDGQLYVKRCQRNRDRSVKVMSDNDNYDPFTIPAPDVPGARVVGRRVNVDAFPEDEW